MAKETSLLPKMEVLIIIIFFIGFAIWAFDKCSDTKRTYSEQANAKMDAVDELLNRNAAGVELPPPDSLSVSSPASESPPPTTATGIVVPTQQGRASLYVTIEGLNLRDQPNLKGKVLTRLKLFEEVVFTGEVTDSTEQINMGTVTPNEPWVKIQARGHVGWVYGAGVEYYKKKFEGVQ